MGGGESKVEQIFNLTERPSDFFLRASFQNFFSLGGRYDC